MSCGWKSRNFFLYYMICIISDESMENTSGTRSFRGTLRGNRDVEGNKLVNRKP